MNSSTTTEQINQINNLIAESDTAMVALESARREVCADYNERARKLRDLKAKLRIARNGGPIDLSTIVSDEDARLLANPMRGL